MDKGQLSRTVRELEHLGLVQRAADPEDGRSSLLSPTAEGLERLADARRPYESSLVTRSRTGRSRRSSTSPDCSAR